MGALPSLTLAQGRHRSAGFAVGDLDLILSLRTAMLLLLTTTTTATTKTTPAALATATAAATPTAAATATARTTTTLLLLLLPFFCNSTDLCIVMASPTQDLEGADEDSKGLLTTRLSQAEH